PEDPHNSFLDSFSAGGWLGGFAFLALVLVTVVIGLRHVFVRTPWQPVYIAAYAAFLGEVGESYIIDVQHWRHYYLIMGMVWGLMVAGRAARGTAAELSARPAYVAEPAHFRPAVAPPRPAAYSAPHLGAEGRPGSGPVRGAGGARVQS